jgi:starch synthase
MRVPSVLLIGSEATPFAKTGGLADVLGALPEALSRLGWQATLIMPRYRGVDAGAKIGFSAVALGDYTAEVTFYEAALSSGARVVFLDVPELYRRTQLYAEGGKDYPDNARRFAALARASLEFCVLGGAKPDIVHAHDWQAALAPVYLRTSYRTSPVLGGIPSVLTIHNLAYQGSFEPDWLPRLDLPRELFALDGMEYWGKISFLKGGIRDASLITTVSETYAKEIQTPQFGFGFDGILRARARDLAGIRNGIDTEEWDPARDRFLPEPFTAANLDGKLAAKAHLLERYGFAVDDALLERPLVGMISRMVYQKGLDLIAAIADDLLALDLSFVVLGTGEPRYEVLWRGLAQRRPDRVAVSIGFDEPLAHLIEAGADLFLMPSRFEPCGLNQMYSQRYGTLPVVRAVGGLADTITDGEDGFSFVPDTPAALLETMRRARATFDDRPKWRAMQATAMSRDHSWDRSAREYVRMYEALVEKRAKG